MAGTRQRLRQCTGSDYRAGMATVRKTPQRTVVVDDDLWSTARQIAELRRESVSDVLRRALLDYVEQYGSLIKDDPDFSS